MFKRRYLLVSLIAWGAFLWACTPEAAKTIPSYESTPTYTQIILSSPIPSFTSTKTMVSETDTVTPSATSPEYTATETPGLPDIPQEICRPGELENFLADLSPIADQIILLGREATQLEELPKTRVKEILTETIKLKPALNQLLAPTCLEHSYRKAVEALTMLESSLNYLLEEDYDTAKTDLQESLIAIVDSITEISIMSWELTATSTPTR